ncbi:hypothetical protein [Streptomyces sp. NPDC005009]
MAAERAGPQAVRTVSYNACGAHTRQHTSDTEYRNGKADGLLEAGLCRTLAYATVLGLREAHLVHAAGRRPERFHQVCGTAGPDGREVRLITSVPAPATWW